MLKAIPGLAKDGVPTRLRTAISIMIARIMG